MTETIKYYAIIGRSGNQTDPTGIARRRTNETGGFRDEALEKDMSWRFSPAIVEWKRAESSDDLIEISDEEAEQLIERLRARWDRTS
jgi:hypothetical protein